jgi:hypothetical protein
VQLASEHGAELEAAKAALLRIDEALAGVGAGAQRLKLLKAATKWSCSKV